MRVRVAAGNPVAKLLAAGARFGVKVAIGVKLDWDLEHLRTGLYHL